MPEIVFSSTAKLLVVCHAMTAIVLLGAATHQIVVAWRARGGRLNPRLAYIYAATTLAATVVTVALGALAYPTYRYFTRGLYLDHCAVSVSKTFDVKEDLAVFALAVAVLVWTTARRMHRHSPRLMFDVYLGASVAIGAIVWFNAVSGFVITVTRGIP
jgi:hypothetical protein